MQALHGMPDAAIVQDLLESMLSQVQPSASIGGSREPTLKDQKRGKLLLAAFAHIPFFSNLPEDVRQICSTEPFAVMQVTEPKDETAWLIYRQGTKMDANAGLYVILDGEVSLHTQTHGELSASSLQRSANIPHATILDDFGPDFVRLKPGDAFGDEVLAMHDSESQDSSASSRTRSTSALVPKAAVYIHITNATVLHAIVRFLKLQSSMLYFLHPCLCLEALRKAADERSQVELVRVAQCLDAVGVFANSLGPDVGLQVASTVEFADYIPGQHIFLEHDVIEACCVLVYGNAVLCQDGAAPPDDARLHNPTPHLGNVVDELTFGDVLIDPAPWFHGVWPCSAVASTRAGVIMIPEATYLKLRSKHDAFAPHQFVKLLSKPASTRTRLDNHRVAQFLSSFPSMNGVPMDKRSALAQLMSLDTYETNQYLTPRQHHELIVLSGQMLAENVLKSNNATDTGHLNVAMFNTMSPTAALQMLEQTTSADKQTRQHTESAATPAVSSNSNWLQMCAEKGFTLHLIIRSCTGHTLKAYLREVVQIKEQTDDQASRAQFLGNMAPFVSAFELLLLARSLENFRESASGDRAPGCSALEEDESRSADRVQQGEVFGWHVFPCETEKERSRLISPTDVAVLAHRDIEGLHSAQIFRQSSSYIQPQWQSNIIEALRSPPNDRSPEDVATTVTGLQNIPMLVFLQQEHADAYKRACAQMVLRQLRPGATICSQGQPVGEIFIVLQGTLESVVSAHEQHLDHEQATACFWQSSRKKPISVIGNFRSSRPLSANHSINTHMHHDPEPWSKSFGPECTAVYGPGDSVGLADMQYGTWLNSLVASHQGCSLAAIPRGVLESHSKFIVSKISSTVSASTCIRVLQVPRQFVTQNSQMLLHMLLSRTPSFMGLSEQCIARLCAKVFHRHMNTDQIVYVEGEDAELYALVMKGSVASYSGLPAAVKDLLAPHSGRYVASHPLRHLAQASMSLKLFRLLHDDVDIVDSALEEKSLWEQSEFDLDPDGNISYSKGHTNLCVGNVRDELINLDAPASLLAKCNLMVSGSTAKRPPSPDFSPSPSLARFLEPLNLLFCNCPRLHRFLFHAECELTFHLCCGRRRRSSMSMLRKQGSMNGGTRKLAPKPEVSSESSSEALKLGQASHRLVLHFGQVPLTIWGDDADVLCKFLLCIFRHWIAGKDHPLGNLVKTICEEGEVGTGVLLTGRHLSRQRRLPCDSLQHNERPSTAGNRPPTAQRGSQTGAQKGQIAAQKGPISAQPACVDSSKIGAEQDSVIPKNASSIVALEPRSHSTTLSSSMPILASKI